MLQHTAVPKSAKISTVCTKPLVTDQTTFSSPLPMLCFSALFLLLSIYSLLTHRFTEDSQTGFCHTLPLPCAGACTCTHMAAYGQRLLLNLCFQLFGGASSMLGTGNCWAAGHQTMAMLFFLFFFMIPLLFARIQIFFFIPANIQLAFCSPKRGWIHWEAESDKRW